MTSKIVVVESPTTISIGRDQVSVLTIDGTPNEVFIIDSNIKLDITETSTTVSVSESGPQGIQGLTGTDGGNLRYDFLIGNGSSLAPQINDSMIHAGSTVSMEIASTGERVLADHVVTEGRVVFSFSEAPTTNQIKVWIS